MAFDLKHKAPMLPRKIILITDGDKVARRTVETVAREIGGRCISCSAGNPTALSGESIVEQIKKAKYDPVLVMVDDSGSYEKGAGEKALEYIANHPDINVLGAIAVASKTAHVRGVKVHASIDLNGKVVHSAVGKDGIPVYAEKRKMVVYGDTVDVLQNLNIPFIVGIGDIGKMHGHDGVDHGAPITRRAVELIMERSGHLGEFPAGQEVAHIEEAGGEQTPPH